MYRDCFRDGLAASIIGLTANILKSGRNILMWKLLAADKLKSYSVYIKLVSASFPFNSEFRLSLLKVSVYTCEALAVILWKDFNIFIMECLFVFYASFKSNKPIEFC